MGLGRTFVHLAMPAWRARRCFTPAVFAEVEAAIRNAEARHAGEICFVVEGALDLPDVWRGLTPRARALEVFAQMRVWDTEANNGILLYVLLADHAVEIVADRGIAARVAPADWSAACDQARQAYAHGRFAAGSVGLVASVAVLLELHFPHARGDADELPNQPVLL